MFAVLNFVDINKKRIKKGRSVTAVHEIKTGKDKFVIVDVAVTKNGVDFKDVERFLGRFSGNVLLPESTDISGSSLKRFDATVFLNIILINTLKHIIKQLYLSDVRVSCVVIDDKGKYTEHLNGIARYAARTTVVTSAGKRYSEETEKLYGDLGVGVSVTRNSDIRSDDTIVIDLDGAYIGSGTVFSVMGNGYRPYSTDGFNDLKILCPNYINNLHFLAALYSLNDIKRLETAICAFLKYGNDICSAEELIVRLRKKLSRKSEKSIIFYV